MSVAMDVGVVWVWPTHQLHQPPPAVSGELLVSHWSSLKEEQDRDAVPQGSTVGVQGARGAGGDPACRRGLVT